MVKNKENNILSINLIVKILSLIVFLISLFFASWFALHGDIIFHTDIARDFLLLEDVVKYKPITLIGPRSGGIPGVFHGPAWTYLNLPAFIIGAGNPAVVGWFWVVLFVLSCYAVYFVGKKVFSPEVGYIGAALTGVGLAFSVSSFFNPVGAVILAPLFIYTFYQYWLSQKNKYLLWTVLVLGLMIQFQMAFAVPILVLFIPLVLFLIIKNRKFVHILSLLIILIPLSTFILFDLKHQFLQTKSVMNYITGKENTGKVDKKLDDIIRTRIRSTYTDGVGFVTKNNNWMLYLLVIPLFYSLVVSFKNKKLYNKRLFLLLILYFYFGYWIMTIGYRGMMWGYYYWPFLGLVALTLASTYDFIDKRLFIIIFIIFSFYNIRYDYLGFFKPESYFGGDGGSWKFNYLRTKRIYEDAGKEFGYYIFTDDQFGYSNRYAMNFTQQQFKNKIAFPYTKKKITYLLISPSGNPTISDDWWKAEKVKIRAKPVQVWRYKSGFRIEKYELSGDDLNIPSDENLIHTLIFR